MASSSSSSSDNGGGYNLMLASSTGRMVVDTAKVQTVGVAKYMFATQCKLDHDQCKMTFAGRELSPWEKLTNVCPIRESGYIHLVKGYPVLQKLGLKLDRVIIPEKPLKTGAFRTEDILVYCTKPHDDGKCIQNGCIRVKCHNCQLEYVQVLGRELSHNPSWNVILENTAIVYGNCLECNSIQKIDFYFKCKGSNVDGSACNNSENVIALPDVERGTESDEYPYYLRFSRCDHRLPLIKDLLDDGGLYYSLLRGRQRVCCPEKECDQRSCVFVCNLVPLGCVSTVDWSQVFLSDHTICQRCFHTYPSSVMDILEECPRCHTVYCKAHKDMNCEHSEIVGKIDYLVDREKRQYCPYGCSAPLEYPESLDNTKVICSKCSQPACYVCGRPDHYLSSLVDPALSPPPIENCCMFEATSSSTLTTVARFHKNKIVLGLKTSIVPLLDEETFETISITLSIKGEHWTYHITHDDIF